MNYLTKKKINYIYSILIISTIFDYHLSIVIFRHNQSIQQQNGNDNDKTTNLDDPLTDDMNSSSTNVDSENPKLEISNPKTRLFLTKQPKGSCIDVWWLYDDGGLTLLLPYLIRSNPQWNGCKLRVFALANKQSELDIEQRNMATLLSKFRIDFSSVTLITDILKPPKEESKIEFDNLIEKYLQKDDEQENECKDFLITNDDLEQFKEKVKFVCLFFVTSIKYFYFITKNNRIIEIYDCENYCYNTQKMLD